MKVFYCEKCDYNTDKLSNFRRHMTSRKHSLTVDEFNNLNHDECKKDIFSCNICKKNYTVKSSLYKHKKKCTDDHNKKNELAEIDFLKQELLKKDEQLKKKMKCMIDI